jgi:hypothetical protein
MCLSLVKDSEVESLQHLQLWIFKLRLQPTGDNTAHSPVTVLYEPDAVAKSFDTDTISPSVFKELLNLNTYTCTGAGDVSIIIIIIKTGVYGARTRPARPRENHIDHALIDRGKL